MPLPTLPSSLCAPLPTSAEQTQHIESLYGAHNYASLPISAQRAKGCWVYDQDNTPYLDMMSAYSAVSLGHSHPLLVRTLAQQAKRLAVTSRAYFNPYLAQFLHTLHNTTGFDCALPMNSGAEAVETALKVARKWGYLVKQCAPDQARIIVCDSNFHGRTSTIVGFSSEAQYKNHFGPFTNGFDSVPFNDACAIEKALTPNTCAVLIEPIQGEAGIIVPHDDYLRQVRDICDRHRVLLICDEIQTGLARTGALFAFEHSGVRPDGLILGKALGGGLLPISAFCTAREIMDVISPGDHGSTFGGNPLACAVATQALQLLTDPALIHHVHTLGTYFLEQLHQRFDAHPLVTQVRGKGLFCALQLHSELPAHRFVLHLLHQHRIISKDTHGHTVRLAPPLTITKKQLDFVLKALGASLAYFEKHRSQSP